MLKLTCGYILCRYLNLLGHFSPLKPTQLSPIFTNFIVVPLFENKTPPSKII